MIQLPTIYRFTPAAETSLQLIPHQELELLRNGHGSEESFHTLAARLNMGAVAIEWHWKDNQDALNTIGAALDAIVSVGNRGSRLGKCGVSGDEFKAIGDGLNLTDEAQKALTRKQLSKILQHVLKVATR